MVTHLAFYSGWPNAVSALNEIERVFAGRNVDASTLRANASAQPTSTEKSTCRATAGQTTPALDAPKFAELTEDVIFGDLWCRTDLSPRGRSLVSIAALAAGGDEEQLRHHIARGLSNGLSQAEIGEALTHLTFYAGWPKASAAIATAGQVFAERADASPDRPTPMIQVVPPAQSPTAGPASRFTGSVVVTSAFRGTGEARLCGATVTFQAGARTNWHTHPLGQLLVVTEGQGLVQAQGEAMLTIKPGDTVWIPPGTKHWHGAAPRSPMTHVAISEAKDGTSVTWLEAVSDDQYAGPAS